MSRTITSEILIAYSQCLRKAFLLLCVEEKGTPHEYVQILQKKRDSNQNNYIDSFQQNHSDVQPYTTNNFLRGSNFLVNATLTSEVFAAECGILTRVEGKSALGEYRYEPTIFVSAHHITKEHKLELSFVGHVLNLLQGIYPVSGRIVGLNGLSHKVALGSNTNLVNPLLQTLQKWISLTPSEPDVILNKHCSYCEFRDMCYRKAREVDHLSLLRGIGRNEIDILHRKGIFTVTQYSYTYHPRRKRAKGTHEQKYYYAIKALSIRNSQIHVVHKPIVNLNRTLIFFDVEGIPDQNFHYLIGLVIVDNSSVRKISFWANDENDERVVWESFLEVLRKYESFSLFHYGSYDARFIEKMLKKYPEKNDLLTEKIQSSLVNVVTLIYANIYFPTYSNTLKEIGSYLGFRWSVKDASGIRSLAWRYEWETNNNDDFKQRIIEYNLEDCMALNMIVDKIASISYCFEKDDSGDLDITLVNNLRFESECRTFKRNQFALEELEFINRCAYFNYQRDKIYFRDSDNRKDVTRNRVSRFSNHEHHVNEEIIIPAPRNCIKCGSNAIGMHDNESKTVLDMRFSQSGISKWVVKYFTRRVKCRSCKSTSYSDEFIDINEKYGRQLKIWAVYQIIALRQPYGKILESLHDIFDYDLPERVIYDAKREMAKYYRGACDRILLNLKSGRLIHADETTVSIKGANAYVWVFTSLKEVVYMYSPTREGAILKDIFNQFEGVLVSDFYAAYDSIECVQQKCLIHLVRDMNDDLLRNPFDDQYKMFLKAFSELLKKIISTIDEHGLEKIQLSKHKAEVDGFFARFVFGKFDSVVVSRYQKRFANNQSKLFTFLDYDGIPWNNNNAEHAIKGFAAYRKTHDGLFTERGIEEYLVLLSIYKTCEYRGVDFLQFLLSQKRDIDSFLTSRNGRSQHI